MTTANPQIVDIQLSSDDVRVLAGVDGSGEVHLGFLAEPHDRVTDVIEAWPYGPPDLSGMTVEGDYLVLHLKDIGIAGDAVRWLWGAAGGGSSPLDEIVAKARSIEAARLQALSDVKEALDYLRQ